jgi:hypothetical protein
MRFFLPLLAAALALACGSAAAQSSFTGMAW